MWRAVKLTGAAPQLWGDGIIPFPFVHIQDGQPEFTPGGRSQSGTLFEGGTRDELEHLTNA